MTDNRLKEKKPTPPENGPEKVREETGEQGQWSEFGLVHDNSVILEPSFDSTKTDSKQFRKDVIYTENIIRLQTEFSTERVVSASGESKRRIKEPAPVIWAVGGGKGGSGKSLVAANLGLAAARKGVNTVVVDLDTGGSNLHTCLGEKLPKKTIQDFIDGTEPSLPNLITPTSSHRLFFIGGTQKSTNPADLRFFEKNKISENLRKIPADIVILDLGPGSDASTLDFFMKADAKILVFTPEPTAIENAYQFLKTAFYRLLETSCKDMSDRETLSKLLDQKETLGIESPEQLTRAAISMAPEFGERLATELEKLAPKVVMNMTRTSSDSELGSNIAGIARKYFGMNTRYSGNIDYDPVVWQAVRKRKCVLVEYPYSPLQKNFDRIAETLMEEMQKKTSYKRTG